MSPPEKDPLTESLVRLSDNAYWRHYVSTVVVKRDAAVRKLLYAEGQEVHALRGEARALDTLITEFKRHGVKL